MDVCALIYYIVQHCSELSIDKALMGSEPFDSTWQQVQSVMFFTPCGRMMGLHSLSFVCAFVSSSCLLPQRARSLCTRKEQKHLAASNGGTANKGGICLKLSETLLCNSSKILIPKHIFFIGRSMIRIAPSLISGGSGGTAARARSHAPLTFKPLCIA